MSIAHKDELDNVQSTFSEIKDKISQLTILPTPPVITNVVVNNDSNSADIYFTEPDDAQGFILVYKEGSAPENRNDGSLIKHVTSPVIVKNLSPQYTYYFVVYAYSMFKKYKKSNIETTPMRLVTGVRVNKKHIFLEVGQSDQVTATVLPPTAANKMVHWSSSDETIATVDDDGLITAIGKGNCIITVTTEDGNFTETSEIEVLAEVTNVEGITLNKYVLGMEAGDKFSLVATIIPDDATNKYIYWMTSDASIATVDENGVVTCRKRGSAIITAMSEDGFLTAECEIKGAVAVEQIILNKNSLQIKKGTISTLVATVQPSDATTTLLWSSSDNSVATVDQTGKITAVDVGTADITVRANGVTATCTVMVIIGVTGVSLNKDTTVINKGDTEVLIATVAPENATNKSVTWSSSNEDVATVDDGEVRGIANGTANIIVQTNDGDFSDVCVVTVNVPVTGIVLDETELYISIDKQKRLIATISPSDASNKNISWFSNNTDIVEVDQQGNMTFKAVGTATITVTTEDGNYSASCNVQTYVSVTGISLNKNSLKLNTTETETLIATVLPENATNKNVTWSSNNESVITVDNGKLVPISAGTARIQATTEDGKYSAYCNITVVVPVAEITLNKNTLLLGVGKSEQLIATINPDDASNQNLVWTSSNSDLATVSQSGLVTVKGIGRVTISVMSEDGGYIAICIVSADESDLDYVDVTGITLNETELVINEIGDTYQLVATIIPSDATIKTVLWRSLDNSVCTVSPTGLVTAVAYGSTQIIASSADGKYSVTCDVSISQYLGYAEIPTPNNLNYNGSDQRVTWNDFDATILTISGVTQAKDVGEYEAIFSLKKYYAWSDNTTEDKIVKWYIYPTIISDRPSTTLDYDYTGNVISPRWSNYNQNQLSISGDLNGTNLGEYSTSFTPKTGYTWGDGSVDTISITWNINPVTILTIPSVDGNVYYTGGETSPRWSNYNSKQLLKGGDDTGRNLGEYTTTFTPNYGYQWEDETQETKEITWNILPVTIEIIPSQKDRIYYTGNNQSPTWNNYNTDQLEISGTIIAKNVGNYTAIFTPLYGYQWKDGTSDSIEIAWTIEPTTITSIPSAQALDYNGTTQSPVWQGYDSNMMTINGDTSNSTVGEHTVYFTPIEGVLWWDGTTEAKSATWIIQRTKIDKPSIIEDYFIYSGEDIIPAYNGYDDTQMEISGDVTAKEAGEYTVTFIPKYGYIWKDDSSETNYNIDWIIDYAQTVKPYTLSTFVYTGSNQSPIWENYDTSRMTKSGDAWGKNAGSYTTVFTLLDNYKWTDGSKEPYSVVWIIKKAPTSLSPVQTGELVYNGELQSPIFENYDKTILEIKGETEGLTAGTYTAVFVPTSNYYYEDGSDTKSIDWIIKKAVIASIPIQSGELIYDRSEKSPTWNNYDAKFLNIGGVTAAIAAATYTAKFTPVSSVIWWDNTSGEKTADWTIQKSATLMIPQQTNELIYNNRTQVPIWSVYDTNLISITGETSALDAGEHEVIFSIIDSNYAWEDGTEEDKIVVWEIKPNVISEYPYQTGKLFYNGESQTPTWENYDEGMYIMSGDVSATDAGTYTARFKPSPNYTWLDGTRDTYNAEWIINTLKIAMPSVNGAYYYTGELVTPDWTDYDEKYMSMSGQINGTDVGTYTTIFTLNKNCIWINDSTDPYSVDWEIVPAKLYYPSTISQFTYDGELHSPEWTNYDENKMTIGGTYEATDQGDYVATFIPKSNYTWTDGTRTPYTVTWSIIGRPITIPSITGTLTYNAEEQSPTWTNYDPDLMIIGGTYAATNAGEYTATFTLNGTNYLWEDNTSDVKSISWSIEKAEPVLEVYPTTITLDNENPESGFSVTYTEGATLEFE